MNNLVNSVHHTNNPINGMSEYSTASGSNVILFEITGNQNEMLNLNSIRLCAKVGIRNADDKNVQNFGWAGFANGGLNNGAISQAVGNLNANVDVNARVGLSSCIQSITLMDGNNNTLESVYQYGSLLHKVSQLSMSADDMGTWGGCYYGISSFGKALVSQRSLNSDRDLSMKLYSGVLQSRPIPFSLIGNKLKIQIQLAPSSQIFFTSDLDKAEVGMECADNKQIRGLNARAKLRDIKLTYRTIILGDKAPVMKQYPFKHFTTLQNTISSSNNTTQYHPTATNAISIMSSFIPSNYLNNFGFDSFLTGKLTNGQLQTGAKNTTDINEIRFLKNSTQFPLQFPVNERVVLRKNSFPTQQLYYYLSTITQMDRLDNCIVNPTTEKYGSVEEFSNPDYNVPVYGVGIRYDSLEYGQGTNFTNSNYLLRLDSGLNGNQNNEVLTQVLSTRRIVMGAGQPVVMV